jgi:hypothetical protein
LTCRPSHEVGLWPRDSRLRGCQAACCASCRVG